MLEYLKNLRYVDDIGMKTHDLGLSGTVSTSGLYIPINDWMIVFDQHHLVVRCERKAFVAQMSKHNLLAKPWAEMTWEVRCDNEDHIYYGIARLTGMSHIEIPAKAIQDTLDNNMAINYEFVMPCYGPYHIAEAKAMARNGNVMFLDTLPGDELHNKNLLDGKRIVVAKKISDKI